MDIIDVYVQKQQQQQDNYNSFSINTINIIKGSKKKEEKRDALFNKKRFLLSNCFNYSVHNQSLYQHQNSINKREREREIEGEREKRDNRLEKQAKKRVRKQAILIAVG